MKAGFTGTQIGMSLNQVEKLKKVLTRLGVTELHHGDCIGADAQAHEVCLAAGIDIVIHPPVDGRKRAYCDIQPHTLSVVTTKVRRPYLDRNHDIVDDTDMLIAAPKDEKTEELRSGTWATIRYAEKKFRIIAILDR